MWLMRFTGLIPLGLGKKQPDEPNVNGNGGTPDFVVSPDRTAYPAPKGVKEPSPVINDNEKQTNVAFTGGKGR